MWYFLVAWIAWSIGFVAGCWWARRPLVDLHERIRTTVKVHEATRRAVFIPDDPLDMMAEETLNNN